MYNKIITASIEERKLVFIDTSKQLKISEAIVEKDFWVLWILDYLFNYSKFRNHLIFKGGTSLSKAYNIINRFSEDIDLVLDLDILDYNDEYIWLERSFTQQIKVNESINEKSAVFLKTVFLPSLNEDFGKVIKDNFSIKIDVNDKQTIVFKYPRSLTPNYVLPVIKLEIGGLASKTPYECKSISSYVYDANPKLKEKDTFVKVIMATNILGKNYNTS